MYPECVAFLRKTMRVREKVVLVRLSQGAVSCIPMRCVFAQNYESERDSNISASLSLSWFRAKTQRIPDTWDGSLKAHGCRDRIIQTMTLDLACEKYLLSLFNSSF